MLSGDCGNYMKGRFLAWVLPEAVSGRVVKTPLHTVPSPDLCMFRVE